jgi:inositol 3-alpha-galactosyltransferase
MADQTRANQSKDAYVTLLTRPSYLAGAVLLAYTLNKHSPNTPLIITYTPETLAETSINAFKAEAKHSNIILHPVEHLRLPEDGTEHGMVAERFIDTWTKLRVFDLWDMPEHNFERICWLDADMMIFSNSSPLIFNSSNDEYLKGGDGMRTMAVHTCVCNLDHDSWAPPEWNQQNCAMHHLTTPTNLQK